VTGFSVFLGKELREIWRTWRIWVIPGMMVFFAITGPLIALATPRLVASFAGSQPGLVIQIPDPTARDALGQFLKNLSQIVIIAIIITGAGAVSGERASGTAVLTLSKPLSRAAFVVAKVVAQQLLLLAATIVGTVLTVVVTEALFNDLPVRSFVMAVGLWLGFALLLIAVMTFFSVLLHSRGGAAGLGLGFLFIVLLLSAWKPVAASTFAGLLGASASVLAGQPVGVGWPLVTAGLGAVLAIGGAIWLFRRQEL
jgi:ABC-2 type transport system permease protein